MQLFAYDLVELRKLTNRLTKKGVGLKMNKKVVKKITKKETNRKFDGIDKDLKKEDHIFYHRRLRTSSLWIWRWFVMFPSNWLGLPGRSWSNHSGGHTYDGNRQSLEPSCGCGVFFGFGGKELNARKEGTGGQIYAEIQMGPSPDDWRFLASSLNVSCHIHFSNWPIPRRTGRAREGREAPQMAGKEEG